jgi:hypothetical protein
LDPERGTAASTSLRLLFDTNPKIEYMWDPQDVFRFIPQRGPATSRSACATRLTIKSKSEFPSTAAPEGHSTASGSLRPSVKIMRVVLLLDTPSLMMTVNAGVLHHSRHPVQLVGGRRVGYSADCPLQN